MQFGCWHLLLSLKVPLIWSWQKTRKGTPNLCPLLCNCRKKHKTEIQFKINFQKYTVIFVIPLKYKGERFFENGSGLDLVLFLPNPSQNLPLQISEQTKQCLLVQERQQSLECSNHAQVKTIQH